MALRELWTIAYRDLGRNRRRTLFTMLAVALGLMLIVLLNGYIAGAYEDSLQNNIRLETGHLQLRAASYRSEQMSLKWEDLVSDAAAVAAQASALSEVNAAAPVLWSSALLSVVDDSAGVKLYGINPDSSIHAPIREAMVVGTFLTADDRGGILVGKRLADDLGMGLDQRVTLSLVNADGQAEEAIFTIRGFFSTGFPAYDQSAVFLPLDKAQAFTRTAGRASAILIMLHQREDTDKAATALQAPGLVVTTWRDLNAVMLDALSTGQAMYAIMYGIVLLVVAVVIANTLLMAVFERIREIGILAALGMKRGQIIMMFVLEASIIGLFGVAIGNVLGGVGLVYLSQVGIPVGDMGAAVEGFMMGTSLHAKIDPASMALLSIVTLGFTLLASLYPAWFAGRLEPVDALHSQ